MNSAHVKGIVTYSRIQLRARNSLPSGKPFAERTPQGMLNELEIIVLVQYTPVHGGCPQCENVYYLRTQQGCSVQIDGVKSFKAVWPDNVMALIYFPKRNLRPTKHQLIDAYRNACCEGQGGDHD